MGIIASPGGPAAWATAAPADVGLAPELGARLDRAAARGELPGLHGFLAVRHGRLAVERYYPGADQHWGTPLTGAGHGPVLPHDLRSITKSITGLLYGIALNEGAVPPVVSRIADALPDHAARFDDSRKRRITVGHVLSMRMGLAWAETLAYDEPDNPESRMEAAPDRIGFVLDQPMAGRPGAAWAYCGGATAILAALIERGTGERLEGYAARRLFAPLGIGACEWINGRDGRAVASSGLRMTARDLARIGQMVLDRGRWQGTPVVPTSWIAASMKPRAFVEAGLRYGYQWWLGRLAASGRPWYAAFGNGGQRLFVIPSLKLVVVIFAGNYNAPDQWKMPIRLMARFVVPAVQDG